MTAIALWLGGLSLSARWEIVGAASAGTIGAVTGLVFGLRAYAPTAVFAIVDLGLPAAIVGGVVGPANDGVIVTACRRIKRNDPRTR